MPELRKYLLIVPAMFTFVGCVKNTMATDLGPKKVSVESGAPNIGETLWQNGNEQIRLRYEPFLGVPSFVAYFQGTIFASQMNDLKIMLKHVPPEHDLILKLNSDGGSADGVFVLAEVLKTRNCTNQAGDQRPCKLITLVPENSECSSACAFLYAAGDLRLYENGSRFGFHAQQSLVEIKDGIPVRAIDAGAAEEKLLKAGFLESWVLSEAKKGTFSSATFTYYSGQYLETTQALLALHLASEKLMTQITGQSE